jgi:hypothetical protein
MVVTRRVAIFPVPELPLADFHARQQAHLVSSPLHLISSTEFQNIYSWAAPTILVGLISGIFRNQVKGKVSRHFRPRVFSSIIPTSVTDKQVKSFLHMVANSQENLQILVTPRYDA